MAQSIYDVAGTPLFFDSGDADDTRELADFLTVTQGDPITTSSAVIEGYARPLRKGTSAFLFLSVKLSLSSDGVAGQPIVVDLGPIVENGQGFSGGITALRGDVVCGAGGVVGGGELAGAGWACVSNGGPQVKLVDKDGVPITTALASPNDKLGFQLSGLVVSD